MRKEEFYSDIDEYEKIIKYCKRINYKLDRIERKLNYCVKKYEESKNADLMIITRLENIADFLKNNYNVVIEENEKYTYPY